MQHQQEGTKPTHQPRPLYRLVMVNAQRTRITRYVSDSRRDAAINEAFDVDGAQFLAIKRVG